MDDRIERLRTAFERETERKAEKVVEEEFERLPDTTLGRPDRSPIHRRSLPSKRAARTAWRFEKIGHSGRGG